MKDFLITIRKNKHFTKVLLGALLLIVFLILVVNKTKVTEQAKYQVTKRTVSDSIELAGTINVDRRVDLGFATNGRIGLQQRHNNRPNQLSGGEQQRVSIARGVAQNQKILFADEPTANLDSNSSASVIETLRDLHEQGQTIVMVTHEAEYTKYCDRVIFLEDGKITDYNYKVSNS